MSFFSPTIERIGTCLWKLKQADALRHLSNVFLVGGFSSSPLIQAIVREKLHGDGCNVVSALRPDVAIVMGAVLFANNTPVFSSRKARLTYGVTSTTAYDRDDPAHVNNYSQHRAPVGLNGKERIRIFSRHIAAGDDIPQGGACDAKAYRPVFPSQSSIIISILASSKKDIEFPDKRECFMVGEITVPMDTDIPFDKRGVKVHITFGGTELSVTAISMSTGEKKELNLSLVQEVEVVG